MDALRTLLISPFFDASLPSGGVLYSMDVTREWLQRGRRVAVLCANRSRSLGDLEAFAGRGQLTVHAIATEEHVRFTHHAHEDVRRLASEAIRAFDPDVIHVHNMHGMLSAVRAAMEWGRFTRARDAARVEIRGSLTVPVIFTALDFGLLCFNFYLYDGSSTPCAGPDSPGACANCVGRTMHGPARWWGRLLPRSVTRRIWPRFVRLDQMKSAAELHAQMGYVLRSLDAIIAPSPIVAERLRAFAGDGVRISEILYGVSPEKMIRPAKRQADCLRLAYLGSVEAVKGFQVLIAAVERLPDGLALEIRAIGNDAVRQVIVNSSASVQRYIRYHPPLFGKQLAEEHANIDAVLVPSLWHENSPFVVLESLANGTPVIASDQAGIRHLIEPDRTGLLIEPGNADAWARALLAAAQRQEDIRTIATNVRFARTTADFLEDVEELEDGLISDEERAPLRVAAKRVVCTASD